MDQFIISAFTPSTYAALIHVQYNTHWEKTHYNINFKSNISEGPTIVFYFISLVFHRHLNVGMWDFKKKNKKMLKSIHAFNVNKSLLNESQ